jgi:hypothetical protein
MIFQFVLLYTCYNREKNSSLFMCWTGNQKAHYLLFSVEFLKCTIYYRQQSFLYIVCKYYLPFANLSFHDISKRLFAEYNFLILMMPRILTFILMDHFLLSSLTNICLVQGSHIFFCLCIYIFASYNYHLIPLFE